MDAPHRREVTLEERFWKKVVKQQGDGCWEWIAANDGRGYGHINVDGVIRKAYRVSYELAFGPIDDGLDVCHKCDNPKCVRPSHLFAASHHKNMLDSKEKGRLNPGQKNGMAKLENADVLALVKRSIQSPVVLPEEADRHGVAPRTIADILYGRRWASVTRDLKAGHSVLKEHLGGGLFTYQLVLNEGGE